MSCVRCSLRHQPQVFAWDDAPEIFSVTIAERVIERRPREPEVLTNDDVNQLLTIAWSTTFEAEHTAHVDINKPVIMVTMPNNGVGMIDGAHRLAQRQALGLPALAYFLDKKETQICRIDR